MRNTTNLLFPYSVRVGKNSDIYVTDTYNHRIRKIEKSSLISVTGGSGGSSLRFPSDMAFSEGNDLYIVDSDHDQIVKRSSSTGLLKKIKEVELSGKTSFASPTQIDIFENKAYVSDTLNDRIIIIDLETSKVKSLPVKRPLGVAVNRLTKEVVFTQRGVNRVSVWRENDIYPLAGSLIFGFTDGQSSASFCEPYGLFATHDGRIIVADAGNHAVREINADVNVTTLAGNRIKGDDDGMNASFNYPMGVCQDSSGVIFVADTYNHKIRKILPNLEVETVL